MKWRVRDFTLTVLRVIMAASMRTAEYCQLAGIEVVHLAQHAADRCFEHCGADPGSGVAFVDCLEWSVTCLFSKAARGQLQWQLSLSNPHTPGVLVLATRSTAPTYRRAITRQFLPAQVFHRFRICIDRGGACSTTDAREPAGAAPLWANRPAAEVQSTSACRCSVASGF